MHSFNKPFTGNNRKTYLWCVYLKAIFRNIFSTKISATFKLFLQKCIILTIFCREQKKNIVMDSEFENHYLKYFEQYN